MAQAAISTSARVDGQVALVTGAGGGIGRATVRALATAGARVVATDLAHAPGLEGERIEYVRHDVTSVTQTSQIVEDIVRRHRRIDILVLCAGVITKAPLVVGTEAEWERLWRTNLMGVVHPLQSVFPLMCKQGGGKIVALG